MSLSGLSHGSAGLTSRKEKTPESLWMFRDPNLGYIEFFLREVFSIVLEGKTPRRVYLLSCTTYLRFNNVTPYGLVDRYQSFSDDHVASTILLLWRCKQQVSQKCLYLSAELHVLTPPEHLYRDTGHRWNTSCHKFSAILIYCQQCSLQKWGRPCRSRETSRVWSRIMEPTR